VPKHVRVGFESNPAPAAARSILAQSHPVSEASRTPGAFEMLPIRVGLRRVSGTYQWTVCEKVVTAERESRSRQP
jgi:hypothetical protein